MKLSNEKMADMTKMYYKFCNEKAIIFLMEHDYLTFMYGINFANKDFFKS